MKQKIEVKVHMNCEKCRIKAQKIAASSNGVEEMRIEGEEKNKVVVIGEGVDSIRLVKCLRKKVGNADLLSVNEVKPGTSNQQDQQQKEKPTSNPTSCNCPHQVFQYPCGYPQLAVYDLQVYDPTPSSCSLM